MRRLLREWALLENEFMRKLPLAAVTILGAILSPTSASLAAGGGGGYDGTVMANVYEYLAARGCPGAGFSLLNCGDGRILPVHRHNRETRHDGKRTGDGASARVSR